ncbi:carbohydrate kinase family protein [uncultured Hymenobacter sp.]|uniref:carbohydrate kinase family protein n=1 Tax=uncultured Hymenobacter sp. TaxID=170016 RepID=UPI0035C9743D
MTSPRYLLAIGEALVDLLTTDFVADLAQTTTLRAVAGGSPANLCRFVQAAGGTAQLVAAVGQDGLGELLLRELAAAGLSTDHVARLAGHATSLIVVGRSPATPSFIPYRGADCQLASVPAALLAGAAVVHTTAFALSRAPAQEHILAALAAASAQAIPVSVDWNYAAPIWQPHDQSQAVWAQLLAHCPLLKVSLDDVARFAGVVPKAEIAKAFLADVPTRALCLTCGSGGVWFRAGAEEWQYQPAPAVAQVHDATGAGDAFWAGFLTSWMQRCGLDSCVAAGQQLAGRRLSGQL